MLHAVVIALCALNFGFALQICDHLGSKCKKSVLKWERAALIFSLSIKSPGCRSRPANINVRFSISK